MSGSHQPSVKRGIAAKPSATSAPAHVPLDHGQHGMAYPSPVIVPIRSLGPKHRDRIAEHLLALDAHDRYLRFGYATQDRHIQAYAQGLDFARDEVFGIYNHQLRLIAMAHLAYVRAAIAGPMSVEFGVSVTRSTRGRGFGSRLFERAMIHARNDGISQMHIHALSENIVMLKIARSAGASVRRDGGESGAYLHLPPPTIDSRLSEIVLEHFAEVDYGMKSQAESFRWWLEQLRPKSPS